MLSASAEACNPWYTYYTYENVYLLGLVADHEVGRPLWYTTTDLITVSRHSRHTEHSWHSGILCTASGTSLLSLVALPSVVCLGALEGLLRLSLPFSPF